METKEQDQLANRPTRSVVRWLNEDRASNEFWRGEAFSLCAELGMLDCDDSEKRDKAGLQLAERLKEETQEGSPLRGVDPYAELVSAAIEDVDWYGVAQTLIGYVCNEVGAAYRVGDMSGGNETMNDYISIYSRAMAIEDGELVDVSEVAKEAGIVFPVAVTRAVWARCVEVPEGLSGQDQEGRLWDVISMLSLASRRAAAGQSTVRFTVLVKMDHRTPQPVELVAVCGPGDDPRPVVTVMFPDES